MGPRKEIGYLRLDQESINVLQGKSGYSVPNGMTVLVSYPLLKAGPCRPIQ